MAVYRKGGPRLPKAGNAQNVVKVAVGEQDGHRSEAQSLDEPSHLLAVVARVYHGAVLRAIIPENITVRTDHAQLDGLDLHHDHLEKN